LIQLEGIVIKSTGSWYSVLAEDHKKYQCRIKGKFRLGNLKSTNPVAIGDRVSIHFDKKLHQANIDVIKDRKNALIRKSPNLSTLTQTIAANLDAVIIVATLVSPRVPAGFIDRYLILAEAYDITPVIVFNKLDLYSEKELELLDEYADLYESLGYKIIVVSAMQGRFMEEIEENIQGKTTFFAGQSGVGKSTILNYLCPDLKIKTAQLASYTGKGRHTTSYYEMHELGNNTFAIDSPGIKELELYNFELYEVGHFMPDLESFLHDCRFNTCLHLDEPDCAVKKAYQEGKIHPLRYNSYISIVLDQLNAKVKY
jgi:ribosome biogenesis GTPase / thiamine phosphate phosphatase